MKFLRILPVAAIACLAVSCQNTGGSLPETASQTDSLMYFLGQMHAADYLRDANRDTTLREMSQKEAYIAGVRAGLSALKEGNENYNKGVMMGMQMAGQIMSFAEHYDVTIDKNYYVSSLRSALVADTLPNLGEIQTQFRTVMTNIEAEKTRRDKESSREGLTAEAAKDNLPKITDDLYGKTTVSNDSAVLVKGDEVAVMAVVTKLDGEKINMPMPPKGKVGNNRNFPEVINDALLTLKNGETGEYLTSAYALLGNRAEQMGLQSSDVLKLTLTPTLLPKPEEETKATK